MEKSEMEKSINSYFKLFLSTFSISAFTLGGGYVIVPLLQKKFVEDLHWIDEEEMLNIVAISQSAPGPIAINTSIMVGYKLLGIIGALVSTLGTSLPPLIIITVVSMFYEQFKSNFIINGLLWGMRAGIAAVILDVIIKMVRDIIKTKNKISMSIMIISFVCAVFLDINAAFIIIISGIFGAIYYSIIHKNKEVLK